jgi:hypothetical protein
MAKTAKTVSYKSIRGMLTGYFAVKTVTNKHIDAILAMIPVRVRRELAAGSTDTADRDYLADGLVAYVMGKGNHWPLNMERGTPYDNEFPAKYVAGCKERGIELIDLT